MKNTHSVCAVLALLALQPFAGAQETSTTPAAPAPAAPAAVETPAPDADKAPADGAVSGINSQEKIDFSGQGKPANKLLSEIAELYNFNISIPDEVNWPVNEAGRDMTWQAYFKLVLEKKGYVYRIDDELVIIEKEKADPTKHIKKLESGNISVDFEKTPVADVVAAICQVMEKNYSPLPPDLEGAVAAPGQPAPAPKLITIKWKGVSWQKTLSEVLARYDYGFREEEGIVRVLPLKVLNDVPSETRVYRINFADAEKVAKVINGVFKEIGAADASKAGQTVSAAFEPSQQLVIVTAKPDVLRNKESEILGMITQIDQPSKQVVIESKIVEKTWDNGFEMGFRYNYGAGNGNSVSATSNQGSHAARANESASAATVGKLSSNNSVAPFSMVLSENDFKFWMDALETDKTANVLQNPSIVVKDDGQGAIRVVRRQPYFESQTTQGTTSTTTYTTKFINIGTSLYIKPKIKADNFIELNINQGEKGGGAALQGGGSGEVTEGNGGLSVTAKYGDATNEQGNTVPITDNRDVRTTVLLRDGYTVALGGLVKDNENKEVDKVPLIGDIPVLGYLFRSTQTGKSKINLMAFITARISDPYVSDYRNQFGLDRVNELGLSSREIEAGSYKVSDAEREALTELLQRRDLHSNGNKSEELKRALNGTN